MDEEPKRKVGTQLTGRVTSDVLEEFNRIKENEGFETFNQFVESLLMHYYNPIKINKVNEDEVKGLKTTIADLNRQLKDLQGVKDAAEGSVKVEQVKYEELKTSYEELRQQYNEKSAELEELQGLQHKMDGHILVPVNELDMRCLEWLASREAKSRKREDITPAVFFQYAVREMLIKGNKFAIDSIPDSIIEKFKKEISNGQ